MCQLRSTARIHPYVRCRDCSGVLARAVAFLPLLKSLGESYLPYAIVYVERMQSRAHRMPLLPVGCAACPSPLRPLAALRQPPEVWSASLPSRRAAIGRAVLGGSSVGAMVRENWGARLTSRKSNERKYEPPLFTQRAHSAQVTGSGIRITALTRAYRCVERARSARARPRGAARPSAGARYTFA